MLSRRNDSTSLSYLVADIVGSSLIMQHDQLRESDLYETFQSILVPVIEKAMGFGIEFTGDAISASFRRCKSAVATGFAIQKALETWNLSSAGAEITARIGIHSSKQGENESQQHLSLAAATCLQSLGRADALCVSRNIIDEISSDTLVHAYPIGRHDLGFLPDTVAVFYLFEEKQAFLRRQGFLLEYLKTEYLDKTRASVIPSAAKIPLLVTATILVLVFIGLKPVVKPRVIDKIEVRNLSNGVFYRELNDMARRIQGNVNSIAYTHQYSSAGNSVSKLVLSLQKNKDRVRLTWGIFQQAGTVEVSGGVVTGNINNLAALERQISKNILAWRVP